MHRERPRKVRVPEGRRRIICDDRGRDRGSPAFMASDPTRNQPARVVHNRGCSDRWSKKYVPGITMIICATACVTVGNTCHCCAERRLIGFLREQARRAGVAPARFSHWIHRKHGVFTVARTRRDGEPGISLPCVICRKMLDKLCITWRAHIGALWVTQYDAPPSRPTQNQRALVF